MFEVTVHSLFFRWHCHMNYGLKYGPGWHVTNILAAIWSLWPTFQSHNSCNRVVWHVSDCTLTLKTLVISLFAKITWLFHFIYKELYSGLCSFDLMKGVDKLHKCWYIIITSSWWQHLLISIPVISNKHYKINIVS